MSRSLLVVNYRTATLAREAIRTARAASREPLQVVVVDNSVDAREVDALRGVADTLIVAESNLGYGAAINRGRRACDGDVIIVTNPDVRFGDASIDRLVETGADVAGPALFWDNAHEWLLPPADLHTTGDRLEHALATRSRFVQHRRDARRIRERVAFWSLTSPTSVRAISGAVMAIRTRALDDAGGFDERFRLYFEETDFLRRVRGEIVYVPGAKCRHLYNQSAAGSNEAATLYAQSERAYLRKWSGAIAASTIKALERPPHAGNFPSIDGPIPIEADDVVIEASPHPQFETAAGRFATRGFLDLPPDVLAAWRSGPLFLRVIDRRSGRVLAAYQRIRMTS
jgi:N-acetylglucosaminyl-diphospho-decaprenol L-rhamnosyltransferase